MLGVVSSLADKVCKLGYTRHFMQLALDIKYTLVDPVYVW